MAETMQQRQQGQGESLVVTVVNEENGRDYPLHAGPGTPLKTLIERMYRELKVERQLDDRLRCEGSGEDVFGFAEMHLGDYLRAGHCPDQVWLFAGGTGGA